MSEFVYQILLRLITANQEKLNLQSGNVEDEDDEIPIPEKIDLANFIMKAFNSLMVKVIKNLNPETLLNSLFSIIINCCQSEGDESMVALYNLCFKCLLKFNKDMKQSNNRVNP